MLIMFFIPDLSLFDQESLSMIRPPSVFRIDKPPLPLKLIFWTILSRRMIANLQRILTEAAEDIHMTVYLDGEFRGCFI
jgi:hypothetical protein